MLEVVTDRKLPYDSNTDGVVDYYTADVVSYSDYYPYGMVMPNRSASSGDYRYGFQDQEMDDEIKGAGNSVNYRFRMHDPRVGRFFAVDPLAPEYAHNSPYAFSENRVLDKVELEGLETAPIMTWQGSRNMMVNTGVNLVNSVTLVGTTIIMPVVRVIYEESTGKMGYGITPWSFTSNFGNGSLGFEPRGDLNTEELTPEQGAEVMNATFATIATAAPIKTGIVSGKGSLLIKLEGMIYKSVGKKIVETTTDKFAEASEEKEVVEVNQNIQQIGYSGIMFDSNKIRKSENGVLIARDLDTGKDYGVVRDDDTGTWDFAGS